MKSILILLLFMTFAFSQAPFEDHSIFAAADTIGSITTADSVYLKLNDGPYNLLTESVNDTAMITGDDKVAETAVLFNLAAEDWWTYAKSITLQIRSTNVDTITSTVILIPRNALGAMTLHVVPDTSGTNTHYDDSYIEGN